jgi:hypothetical protein
VGCSLATAVSIHNRRAVSVQRDWENEPARLHVPMFSSRPLSPATKYRLGSEDESVGQSQSPSRKAVQCLPYQQTEQRSPLQQNPHINF